MLSSSCRLRVWLLFVAAAVFFRSLESPGYAQQATPNSMATRQYAVALGFQKKKLYVQANARWMKFIASFPKDERVASATNHLGICQFRQQQFTQAAKTFQTVLSKFPEFKHLDAAQFNLGLVLYNVAQGSKKPDDYKQAAATFAQVPARFSRSKFAPDARYYQAECLYWSGDKQASLPLYQKLISSYPKSPLQPEAHYALGTAQQELEKFVEAEKTFQSFLTKFPKAAQFHECQLRLGMAQFSQKKFPDAEKLFAQVAAVKDLVIADFALLQQAQAVFEQNKLPEAAALFESLPKKFPTSKSIGSALLSGGKIRYRAKQFPKAQTDFTSVVTKKLPEAPEAAFWLGRTQIQLKKPADAVKTLDQAISAYPKSKFLSQLTLARIDALYELEDRRKETVALYAGFAEKYPKHPTAPEALYRASRTALQLDLHATAQKHAESYLANKEFANHVLLWDVIFIGAESYLLPEKPDLAKAEALYRRLVAENPKHKFVAQAQVRIGFCLYLAKKHTEAIAFLTKATAGLKDHRLLAEAHLLIGRSHRDAGRTTEAVTALRSALQANPKWERGDEVLLLLALSLRAGKDIAGATAELNKLNQHYAKSSYRDRAFYELGEIAFEQKKFDEAANHYRQVVSGFPQSEFAPLAQYGIASALFEKSDYKVSASELTSLLTKYPKAPIAEDGRYLRGMCYQRLKQHEPAVKDLSQFLAGKPDPKTVPNARYALGLSQIGLKQHKQAIATLVTLLKASPDYADADKVYHELAYAYLETKQLKEAEQTFQQLATKLPKSPLAAESWFRVGEFHENSKQLPDAATAFASGLNVTKEPELRERLYYKLGRVQYAQEVYAEATKTLTAQIKEYPKGELLLDATFLAGDCLYRQNKFKDALPFYGKVIAAKSKMYQARALYRSGDCAAHGKQWAASQNHFQTLIQGFPKFEQINEARYGLGFALQNLRKLDDAKKVYKQITQVTNTETAAKSWFMMGECAFAQKKYDEAVEHFLEAALGYPYEEWQAVGYFEAGRCFIELKDNEQARETLETVVKKFSKHPRAKNAATLLAKLDKQKKS